MDKVRQEYERLIALFAPADPGLLQALDGLILEAAKTKCDLDRLNELKEKTGLIKINPKNPDQQKALPVANEITKVRASYTHIMQCLCRLLNTEMEEDDDLADFE